MCDPRLFALHAFEGLSQDMSQSEDFGAKLEVVLTSAIHTSEHTLNGNVSLGRANFASKVVHRWKIFTDSDERHQRMNVGCDWRVAKQLMSGTKAMNVCGFPLHVIPWICQLSFAVTIFLFGVGRKRTKAVTTNIRLTWRDIASGNEMWMKIPYTQTVKASGMNWNKDATFDQSLLARYPRMSDLNNSARSMSILKGAF